VFQRYSRLNQAVQKSYEICGAAFDRLSKIINAKNCPKMSPARIQNDCSKWHYIIKSRRLTQRYFIELEYLCLLWHPLVNGKRGVICVRVIVGANELLCRNSWWTKVHNYFTGW